MKRLLVIIVSLLAFPLFTGCGSTLSEGALDSLPKLKNYKAARVSSYDRTGANADRLENIGAGETVVLAELDGPGMIHHIWITIAAEKFYGRKILLRMFWDDEKDPSVLCPINDFFCLGHGINAVVDSAPITVWAGGKALNSFFKMPFNKKARIEITNEGLEPIGMFYYYIDYRKYPQPFKDVGYFHARYRQEYPSVPGKLYKICDAEGRGHYVGSVLSIESNGDSWWGEGDDFFYIDGEKEPSMLGTGAEDYLSQAWGVHKGCTPYIGSPIHEGGYKKGMRFTSYRFHIEDPIPFTKSLYLEMEPWGVILDGNGKAITGFGERRDNWSSVAYWYQTEPHKVWCPIAPVDERLPLEAGDQVPLLKFMRESAAYKKSESIEPLRQAHAKLRKSKQIRKFHGPLDTNMALAEQAAGHAQRVDELLKSYEKPLVTRSLAKEVWKIRGKPAPVDQGVKPMVLSIVRDGSTKRIEKEGRTCLATEIDKGRVHFYFAFPKDSPLRNIDKTALIKVTYYSEGTPGDTFVVQYDSHYEDDTLPAYHRAEVVNKPEKPGWYTVTVQCPRARFAGRQNGASDFRIWSLDEGEEIVADVEVSLAQ